MLLAVKFLSISDKLCLSDNFKGSEHTSEFNDDSSVAHSSQLRGGACRSERNIFCSEDEVCSSKGDDFAQRMLPLTQKLTGYS
jgi:hypothetical protein